MVHAKYAWVVHPHFMLTEIYIEALLVDEEAADQVWGLWNVGVIPDDLAAMASRILAIDTINLA
jgi:hypothetical protein